MSFGVILLIVLIVFVLIFAVSVPGQMRKQKQANEDQEQAYRDGWQRALDIHGILANGEAANYANTWISEHGQHGSWIAGSKDVRLSPVWEEAFRSALQVHGIALSNSDLDELGKNPYSGR